MEKADRLFWAQQMLAVLMHVNAKDRAEVLEAANLQEKADSKLVAVIVPPKECLICNLASANQKTISIS
jgi:hypothetical protein